MLDSRCTPCYPGERHDWKRLPKREWPTIAICRNCGLTLAEGEEEWMTEEGETMPDEKMAAYLKSLWVAESPRNDGDGGYSIYSSANEVDTEAAWVWPAVGLTGKEAAHALVTAAREWAQWQGVIEKAAEWLEYRRDALETGSQDIAEAYMMADDAFTAAIDAALKEGSDA